MNSDNRPVIQEIDLVTEESASFFEKHYIKLFKSFGAMLVNDTEGGEGVKGRKMSDENKQKISSALKGRVFSENHRTRLAESNRRRGRSGHSISEQAKENIRNGARKKVVHMIDTSGNLIKAFESIRSAGRYLGIGSGEIVQHLKGKSSHVHGNFFKYA